MEPPTMPMTRSESLPILFPPTPRASPSPEPPTQPASPEEEPNQLPQSPIDGHVEDEEGEAEGDAEVLTETQVPRWTLWDQLYAQVWDDTPDEDEEGGGRTERVDNFLRVPFMIEKIVAVGWLICFDAFLYNLTILPLKCIASLYTLFTKGSISASQTHHLLSFSLILIPSALLVHFSFPDPSRMYHSVRGQETIKLYVIYNCMEIADRLFVSFGLDLLDSLASFFTPSASSLRTNGRRPIFRPMFFLLLSHIYVFTHTLILLYLLVSLNVSINSYSNALLTLLLSNQFVEIKGAVFKKFETENLFQISCADIVERFQLSLMLTLIFLRNLVELQGSTFFLLPTSFIKTKSTSSAATQISIMSILSPVLIVLASEQIVDWLKHGFITKFNHLRPRVYERFLDVLCVDLTVSTRKQPNISRRLGFAAIPLACLCIRVGVQTLSMTTQSPTFTSSLSPSLRTVTYVTLTLLLALFFKLVLSLCLRSYAISRLQSSTLTMEHKEEEMRNGRGREPVGTERERRDEKELVGRLKLGERELKVQEKRKVGVGMDLERLQRFDMVKSRLH